MKKFIRLQILFLLTFGNLFAGEGEKGLAPPVAGFTVSTNQGCAPLAVTFTSTSTSPGDPIVSYEWNFGDGNIVITSVPTVSHTYTTGSSGDMEISLRITTQSNATNLFIHPYNMHVNAPNLGPDREVCASEFLSGYELDANVSGSFPRLWSTGSNMGTTKVFEPGTYWVETTDNINGCFRRDTVIISSPIVLNYTYTELSNCGGTVQTKFIDNTVEPGCSGPTVADYKYTQIISGPAHLYDESEDDDPEYTFTTEGTYELLIYHMYGDIEMEDTISFTITFADPNPPTPPALGPDKTICPGGSVTLDAGYEAGVVYSWSPASGLSNPSIYNPVASPGSTQLYTVTKTKCGNTVSGSVTVNVGPPLTVDLGPDTEMCSGQFFDVHTGITGPATFTWTCSTDPLYGPLIGNEPSATIFQPGIYTVTVVKDGCTARDTLVVSPRPSADADFSVSQSGSCAPVTVSITDATVLICGSGPSYRWDFGDGTIINYAHPVTSAQKNPTHIYNAAGTYTITLIVTLGASKDTTTQTVTVAGSSVPVNLGADQTICSGGNITLDAGSFPGATYNWSTGATSQTINVSAAGEYWVEVTSSGCSGRDTVEVSLSPSLVVDLGPDEAICQGSSTTLDAGDFPGATYSWSTGESTRTITVSAGATYTVTVTLNGCSGSDSKNVTVNTPPEVDLGLDEEICSGTTLTLDAGNFPGATYSWSTGETTRTIDVTESDYYSVTVTVNGCSGTAGKFVDVRLTPEVNLGPDQTVCAGTSVMLDAGMYFGATYLWNTGYAFRLLNVTTPGTYSVEVDLNGCIGSDEVIITHTAPPVVDLGPDQTICSGSSITLDAGTFPGATYSWSTGATTQTINVSTANTYTVTVTLNGCSSSDSKTITVNTPPVVDLGPDQTICSGSSITLDAGTFPGATYSWSTGATTQTINVSTANTYTVTVTLNGCSSSDSKTITVNTPPVVDLGPDQTICSGSSITLDAGTFPGATYSWSTGATTQTINVSTANTYTVTVTLNGCSSSDSKTITVNTPPVVDLGPDEEICSGASITLDAGDFPGATYSWSTGATTRTISVSAANTYTVTVTLNGCSGSDSKTVTLGASLTVDLGPDVNVCRIGGLHQLTVTTPGVSSITWDSDSDPAFGPSFQNQPDAFLERPGKYWVTVQKNGCVASDTVLVGTTIGINVGFTHSQTTTCLPYKVKFTSNGLTSVNCGNVSKYKWDFGDGQVVVYNATVTPAQRNPEHEYLQTGTFDVTLTVYNTYNDSASVTHQVTVTGGGAAVNLGNDTTICQGTTLTLDAGEFTGATYEWSNGHTGRTIDVTQSGNYWVLVTVAGCTSRDDITVSVVNGLTVDLGSDTTVCIGNNITLDAGHAGASYLWSTGATSRTIDLTMTQEGSYTYTVAVNKDGCSGDDEITIHVNTSIPVTLGDDVTICAGSSIVLDAGYPGATYLWHDNETTQTRTVNTAGIYSVSVTSNGCTGSAQINVSLMDAPTAVDLGNDTTLCFGNTITLDAGNPGASYLWSTGATTQTIVVSASGTYWVKVTSCSVEVEDEIVVTTSSAPTPSITQSGNELISSPADSYQWYKGGELIPGATARSLKPKGYGNYSVVVGSGDCLGEANYFFVPNGEIYLGDIRVKVTPNPSYGQPKLILSKLPHKQVKVSVFDRIGRKVLVTYIVNTVNELDLTAFAKGEYFAELILDDQRVIIPIITQ
ncbi:MAG: PKD domain-containing protein [Chitinophagaceae bacterium]|nr:PKD domain-containing protein [Chitinophagaceae bacterium]